MAEMWHGTLGVGGLRNDGEEEEDDDDDGMSVAGEANSGTEHCGGNEEALGGEIAWHVVDGVDEDERCLRFEGAVGEISLSRTRCFPFRSSLCCPCSSSNALALVAALMKVSSSKAGCSTNRANDIPFHFLYFTGVCMCTRTLLLASYRRRCIDWSFATRRGLHNGSILYILLLAGIAGVMFATCFMQSTMMRSGEHPTTLPAARKCFLFMGLLVNPMDALRCILLSWPLIS